MSIVIFDETSKQRVVEVLTYAKGHKFTKEKLQELIADPGAVPLGDDPGFRCYFQKGVQVVLTIEEQPFGWSWHFSMSLHNHISASKQKKMLNPIAVLAIMKEFGVVRKSLEDCIVYIEDAFDIKSINVITKID